MVQDLELALEKKARVGIGRREERMGEQFVH